MMQLMSMLQSGQMNPQAMVNMMIGQNPQLKQTWEMANKMAAGKSPEQLQTVVQNLCQQKGVDNNTAAMLMKSLTK